MGSESPHTPEDMSFLCCLGGSSVARYRSALSDIDYFIISREEHFTAIKRAWCMQTGKVDYETRTLEWLADFVSCLDGFTANLSGGHSALNFWDMRFAARVVLGKTVSGSADLKDILERRRDLLRRALAGYFSSFLLSTYEDALGLCLSGRYREVPVIAGELAQRAVLVALLQLELVDPAPKWSLCIASDHSDMAVKHCAIALLDHLGTDIRPNPAHWANSLLRLTNSVVAAGMAGAAASEEPGKYTEATDGLSMDQSIPYCLMGVPGYNTLMDLRSNKVHACNVHFLRHIAAGSFPAI